MVLCSLALFAQGALSAKAEINGLPAFLSERPRLTIPVSLSESKSAFPADWLKAPVSATATLLESSEFTRSRRCVEIGMSRYSTPLLADDLRRVVMFRSISFYGLPFGGTNSNDTVYLTNDGAARGYTDRYITGAFHHEFSSILLRNHPGLLDQAAWNKAIPAGFHYRGTGTDALREGTSSTEYDPSLYSAGFLSQYSQASMEEDFNMLAEGMMTGDPELAKAAKRYPRIRAKLAVITEFYRALDPEVQIDRSLLAP